MKIMQHMPRPVREAAFIASDVLGIRNPNPNVPDNFFRAAGRVALSLASLPMIAVFALPVVGFPALMIGAPVGLLTNAAVGAAALAIGADSDTAGQVALAAGITAACVTTIGAGIKMASSFTGDAA